MLTCLSSPQALTGTSSVTVWASTLIWDLAQFAIPSSGIVSLMFVYRLRQFSGIRLAAAASLLAGLGLSGLPLTYLLQLLFLVRNNPGWEHTVG